MQPDSTFEWGIFYKYFILNMIRYDFYVLKQARHVFKHAAAQCGT
jgi:hypothetical protein